MRAMARIHLFELEDQAWFPAAWRDAGTAYLRKAAALTGQPAIMAPKIAELLRASSTKRIVDLCSGGGGPIPEVVQELAGQGVDVDAVLTDFYPNTAVLERVAAESQGKIDFRAEPVDAKQVPRDLSGCRTLFNGLHHFRPDDARAILQSAAEAKQPIAVFEAMERAPAPLLGLLFAPLAVLFLVPFLRPFRFSWLIFTYLIPIIPLFVLWDGFVSCLRIYSVSELEELVDGVGGDDYVWEAGRIKLGAQPVYLTYLLGHAKA
jgi:SAM-dependent methyltransferase